MGLPNARQKEMQAASLTSASGHLFLACTDILLGNEKQLPWGDMTPRCHTLVSSDIVFLF
jgi:hypothetical protein